VELVVDVVIAGASPFDLYLAHELSDSLGLEVCNLDPFGEWLGIWASDCERLGIERARCRRGKLHATTELRERLISELSSEATPVVVPPGREWNATTDGVIIRGDHGSIAARYAIATPPMSRDVPPWCFDAAPYPLNRLLHVDDLHVSHHGERLLIAGTGPLAAHLYETARPRHACVEWISASDDEPAPASVPAGAVLRSSTHQARSRVVSARWHDSAWLVVSGDERRVEVDHLWVVTGDRSTYRLNGVGHVGRTRWIIGGDGPVTPCRPPDGPGSEGSSLVAAEAAARWTAGELAASF